MGRGMGPKPPSVLIIPSKESQDSLRAIAHTIIIYYRKGHIKFSQGKRCRRQSLAKFPMRRFCCPQDAVPSSDSVTICTQHYQWASSPQLWCPEFLPGFHYMGVIDWLIDCLCGCTPSLTAHFPGDKLICWDPMGPPWVTSLTKTIRCGPESS